MTDSNLQPTQDISHDQTNASTRNIHPALLPCKTRRNLEVISNTVSPSSANTGKPQNTSQQDQQTNAASARDSDIIGKDAPALRNVESVHRLSTTPDLTPAQTASPNPLVLTTLQSVLTVQDPTNLTQTSAKHSKPYESPTKTGRWKNSCNDYHTQPAQSQNNTTQL